MTTSTAKLLMGALVASGLVFSATACSEEVAHSESDKPGWFGGNTHQESTTYKNPDGSLSTVHEKETVKP